MKLIRTTGIISLLGTLWSAQASAHHAMGSETPTNLTQGLLSGLAHPVIGIDHFAFLIVMGIAAAFTSRRLLTPLTFVVTTVVGCLLLVGGLNLPGLEFGVAASVVIVGGMVLSGRIYSGATYIALFAVAGILHGMAYGAAIVNAETTPLLAYLVGFGCIQYAIAVTTGIVARRFTDAGKSASLHPRLAGAVATGIGLAILIENIEGMLVT